MATEYRYGTNPAAVWADLTTTTALNDGVAGDASTGVESTDTASVGPTFFCQLLNTSAPLLVEVQHDNRRSVTAWRISGSVTVALVSNQTVCALVNPDEEGNTLTPSGSVSYSLQYWDGTAWAEADTYSDEIPAVGFAGTETLPVSTGLRTITARTACMWRLVVSSSYAVAVAFNTLNITNRLTDFRLTSTDTGIACSYPPDGNDGEGDTGGGGDTDECPCEWVASEGACADSWAADEAPTTTWTKTPCH